MTEKQLHDRLQNLYVKAYNDVIKRIKNKKMPLTKQQLIMLLLEKEREYWFKRLNVIDEYQVYEVQKAAVMLSNPYINAGRQYSESVKKIYSTYQTAFDLTKSQADTYMKSVKYDRTIAENLKAIADRLPDSEQKNAIYAEIAAPAYRYRMQRAEVMAQNVADTCQQIARAETRIERATLQTAVERSYNITVDEITGKSTAERLMSDIVKQAGTAEQTAAPVSFTEIQEITATTDKGLLDSFTEINDRAVKEIINHNWHGENFSERVWTNTEDVAKEVKGVLIKGELTGASVAEMSADVQKRFEVGAYKARRLIRTEYNYCTNQATLRGYKQNKVERYRYLAILDDRTSEICEEMDGEEFEVSAAAVGVNYPPLHPNCRSTTVPIMSDIDNIEDKLDALLDSIGAPEGVDPVDYLAEQLSKISA